MKNVFLIFTVIIASMFNTITAQSNTEEVDLLQSVFGMEKKAFVAEFIQLEGEKATAFWALYDEYEINRKELGKRRLDLLNAYVENYDSSDEAATNEILQESMTLKAGTDNLITSYTKKMKKEVDVKTATQFFQIEGYILSKIRVEILENIPVLSNM
jgi:hypothetical protein